uniref:Immediate early response 3-interacting protein 1 n=1 Tax=Gallus gallus TaxID=9031 RepID=A0A8V0YCU4_CHICK
MAFTLYALLQAGLLVVNAIAVLHEERFLRHVGWGSDQGIGGFGEEPGIKAQLTNLIRSIRTVMRVGASQSSASSSSWNQSCCSQHTWLFSYPQHVLRAQSCCEVLSRWLLPLVCSAAALEMR